MANTRPKVLGVAFAMLAFASVTLISNEGTVSANAWALLALSGVFATAAVMAFFQQEDVDSVQSESLSPSQTQSTETQNLPDPAESGFDVPVV